MVCTWYSVVLGSGLIWETQSNNKIGHTYGTVWISSGKMCTRWCMYGTMWHWSLNIIFFILNCFLKLFCFISMSRFVYIGNIFILRYKADSNIQNTYIFFFNGATQMLQDCSAYPLLSAHTQMPCCNQHTHNTMQFK